MKWISLLVLAGCATTGMHGTGPEVERFQAEPAFRAWASAQTTLTDGYAWAWCSGEATQADADECAIALCRESAANYSASGQCRVIMR